jgi:hypothetical protein
LRGRQRGGKSERNEEVKDTIIMGEGWKKRERRG